MLIGKFFPPIETALKLKPEDLAIPLLKCILYEEKQGNFVALTLLCKHTIDQKYATGKDNEQVLKLFTEAWLWLEREIFIAPNPHYSPGIHGPIYVTKRGKDLADQSDITKYLKSRLIPPEVLDPVLANKVLHLFTRGDYDTAVFQAFKEVEVRVRRAASLPQELLGSEVGCQ